MKLGLGTVQFGLDYGVTNAAGELTLAECACIIEYAKSQGLSILDTAASYGTSERRIGQIEVSQSCSVITKLPPLSNSSPTDIVAHVESSLIKLNRKKLDGVLFHREEDIAGEMGKQYYQVIKKLKQDGLIQKIGVSFYSPSVALDVLKKFDIDLIQVPASHLDRRFEKIGVFRQAKQKNIEIHVRSLFLQGLLITDEAHRPNQFKSIPALLNYDKESKQQGYTQLQLALSYLTSLNDIDLAVVGCHTKEQLVDIVSAYHYCLENPKSVTDLSVNDLALINPSYW